VTFFTAGLQPPLMKASELMASAPAAAEPVLVYTGPTRTGAALVAAVAADTDQQATPKARGKKSRVARKPDAGSDAKTDGKTSAKTAAAKPAATKPDSSAKSDTKTAAKPAAIKHAATKPDAAAKPAQKPVASGDPAAKPAKPKAVTKPAPKPAPNNS
jgi:D-alanyl-D-alanine carboxypeptidase